VWPVTLWVEGDSGSALGWVRRPGEVIRRLALLAGATAGQIDAANLAALDAAVPRNLSLYLADQASAREIIGAIAASANAMAYIGLDGQLRVTRAAIGSPVLALSTEGDAAGQVETAELSEIGMPFWRLQMEADRTWRVHGAGEYADVGDAVPTLRAFAAQRVVADHTGAILSGQLPRVVQAVRQRGDLDVSASTSWSVSTENVTATVSASGRVTISAVTTTGWVDVTGERDGVGLTERIAVIVDQLPPPSSGSGGGTSASDSTIATVDSATYGTVHAGPLTVRTGTAGEVACSAPLDFVAEATAPTGSYGLRGKWQWRGPLGTWADIAAEISESATSVVIFIPADSAYEATGGFLSVAQTKTGLTPATDYEFQLLLRTPSGTKPRYPSGTASAVGS